MMKAARLHKRVARPAYTRCSVSASMLAVASSIAHEAKAFVDAAIEIMTWVDGRL